MAAKSEEEIEALKSVEGSGVWDGQSVLAILNELVARSGMREELSAPGMSLLLGGFNTTNTTTNTRVD
jgi:hypothetical protein